MLIAHTTLILRPSSAVHSAPAVAHYATAPQHHQHYATAAHYASPVAHHYAAAPIAHQYAAAPIAHHYASAPVAHHYAAPLAAQYGDYTDSYDSHYYEPQYSHY